MELEAINASGDPCTLFVHEGWYVVEGGTIVNKTHDDITSDTSIRLLVESIEGVDSFTWQTPINSLEELIEAVEA